MTTEKLYKYVCITNNKPNTKSNHNLNPIQLNSTLVPKHAIIVACLTYPETFHSALFLLLFVVTVLFPVYTNGLQRQCYKNWCTNCSLFSIVDGATTLSKAAKKIRINADIMFAWFLVFWAMMRQPPPTDVFSRDLIFHILSHTMPCDWCVLVLVDTINFATF